MYKLLLKKDEKCTISTRGGFKTVVVGSEIYPQETLQKWYEDGRTFLVSKEKEPIKDKKYEKTNNSTVISD